MNWKPIGLVLFVGSAFFWAIFLCTVTNLDGLGIRGDEYWVIGEFFIALVMAALGLYLYTRKETF